MDHNAEKGDNGPISLFKIFFTFVQIGSFTFGGGHAMIPLIIRDIVNKKKWVSEEEFIDLFSISQSLPGVFAVNMSMFIGYKLRKQMGAIIAALGTTLPSFCIILILAFCFRTFSTLPVVEAVMKGIRPAVIGMIAIPVLTIWRALRLRPIMLLIPLAAAMAVWYFSVSPIAIIILAGAAGIGYLVIKSKKIPPRR